MTVCGRIVIQPPRAFLIPLGIGLVILCALPSVLGTAALLKAVLAGLVLLLPLGLSLIILWQLASMRLWYDGSVVALTSAWFKRECPRAELAALRLGPPYTRGGSPSCNFVRRDGHIAFRTSAWVWGREALAGFARDLGVPFLSGSAS